MPTSRPLQLKILVSEDERDRLRALAAEQGLDVSNFVRLWIRGLVVAAPEGKRDDRRRRPFLAFRGLRGDFHFLGARLEANELATSKAAKGAGRP